MCIRQCGYGVEESLKLIFEFGEIIDKMSQVKYYDNVADELLKFAVIISKANEKQIFCKHKKRDTYEVLGGHREPNETIFETERRELYEETGALGYDNFPVCVYSVTGKNRVNQTGEQIYCMLSFANLPAYEVNFIAKWKVFFLKEMCIIVGKIEKNKIKKIIIWTFYRNWCIIVHINS